MTVPKLDFDHTAQGPLAGVRVLDLSRLVAGNMATHVLADFGADVVKIERPGQGDDLRKWRVAGQEIYWKIYGRNKRSVELDIKSEHGREALMRLIRSSQVMVENFVPGTLERMGLGPDALHAENPDLVLLRVSGWGQTGPYRDRPGFGTLVEAMSGYAYLNGFPETPPTLPPLALADMVAGLYGAFAVMTALREVEVGSRGGQVIDLSLFEPIFSLISTESAKYSLTGELTERSGNQSTHTAPRNVYRCRDDRFVAMSGSMQSMSDRIFETIGRPELKDDPRFRTNDDRVRHRDELDEIIGGFIADYDQAAVLGIFRDAGVTVGPVYSAADLIDDPFVAGREAMVELPDADIGSLPMHNIIPRLSRSPGRHRHPAPRLGEHTDQVLREIGMAGDEVTQ